MAPSLGILIRTPSSRQWFSPAACVRTATVVRVKVAMKMEILPLVQSTPLRILAVACAWPPPWGSWGV